MEHLKSKGLLRGDADPRPFKSFYTGYTNLVTAGIEEPMCTHADHFLYHTAYSFSAYNKGALFLAQLEYVIGKPAFDKGMPVFFEKWKFKHPDDNDFIRVMENVSGLELDWYLDYMVQSTKTIDYAIDTIFSEASGSVIPLERYGFMPMPVDLKIAIKDGTELYFTIPLDIMRGAKVEMAPGGTPFQVLPDWDWVNPEYQIRIPYSTDQIESVTIDPSLRMADLDLTNNTWPVPGS
jgi:hypothetical protein